MKKFMIAAAVAGTVVAVQANAAIYTVTSDIQRSELALPFIESGFLPKASGYPDSLQFTGELDIELHGDGSYTINSGTLYFTGQTSLVAIGADVYLDFDAAGSALSNGVILNQGGIGIVADTLPEPVVLDLTDPANSVNMTGDGSLYGVQYAGIPLSSGVVNEDGSITITFAGIPGDPESGLAMASAGGTLLGMPAAIFFEGTLTLAPPQEIPLPGAAWLFGSALVGLSAARKRKAAQAA